jgi:hypothetical protein
VSEQRAEPAGVDDPGLIQDDHPAWVQSTALSNAGVGLVGVGEQPGQRAGGDACGIREAPGSDRSQRRPLNIDPGGLPRLACRCQGGGLPGPGRADDQRESGGVRELPDHRCMLGGQPRIVGRGGRHGWVHRRAGLAVQVLGDGQRSAFGGEQFGGGIAPFAVLVAGQQRHRVAGGQDPVSQTLEVFVVDRQPGRDGLAQGLEQVPAVEGAGMPGDAGGAEQLGLQCSQIGSFGWALPAEKAVDKSLGVVPGGSGLVGPPVAQRLFPRVALDGSGGQTGALRGGGTGLPGAGELGFDLAATGGEQPQQRPRDPSDLRAPTSGCRPGNTEPQGQLAAQGRVVDLRGSRRVPEQGASVHRRPPAVSAVHQVRDDQVGVQLRVPGPAGGVVECGHNRPVRSNAGCGLPVSVMPTQRVTGLRLQVGPGLLNRCCVRLPDLVGDVRTGEPEHKRHALRGGHCHVDPGPAHVDPFPGVLDGVGVAVGAVRLPVDGVRVEPGRGGEFAGAG